MNKTQTGLGFARKMYPSRTLVYALGLLSVAPTLYKSNLETTTIAASIILPLIWPHLAFLVARRSTNVYQTERWIFNIDSTVSGFMMPLLGTENLAALGIFNISLISQLMVNGAKGVVSQIIFILLGAAIQWQFFELTFDAGHSVWEVYCALPLLVIGPAVLAFNTYVLSNRLYNQRLEFKEQSEKDGLSNLNNRKYFNIKINECYQVCKDTDKHGSLLLIDIDNFKLINDNYGHSAGDTVIIETSKTLLANIRPGDIAARYGGEEFAILLPGCSVESASALAERIRQKVEEQDFETQNGIVNATISVGLAGFSDQYESPEHWLNAADGALYTAKAKGKNLVVPAPADR